MTTYDVPLVPTLPPAVEVEGYRYYFSTVYGTWTVLSPLSGFQAGFYSENSALRFIRSELHGKKDAIRPHQEITPLFQVS